NILATFRQECEVPHASTNSEVWYHGTLESRNRGRPAGIAPTIVANCRSHHVGLREEISPKSRSPSCRTHPSPQRRPSNPIAPYSVFPLPSFCETVYWLACLKTLASCWSSNRIVQWLDLKIHRTQGSE